MFDTYGPFQLAEHDGPGIDAFYRQIKDDESGLQYSVGLYIIAGANTQGKVIPWYVGITTREFGTRLVEHLRGGKFEELASKTPLSIFLIALRKDGKFVPSNAVNEKQKLVIEQLEQQLIDRCYSLNKKLMNKKIWSPEQIHVPGFIDKGGKERDFPSAQALAKLLGM